MWFPNRSDTNRPIQSQRHARRLKFRILEEEVYYLCSENKGADQLRGYREADLRLCFRLSRLLVFPCGGSFLIRQLPNILDDYRKDLNRDDWCVLIGFRGDSKFWIYYVGCLYCVIETKAQTSQYFFSSSVLQAHKVSL